MASEDNDGEVDIEQLLQDLYRWSGDVAAGQSAQSRSKESWLKKQAQEDATWDGLLVDLAERKASGVLQMRSGRHHQGRIVACASDFVLVGTHEISQSWESQISRGTVQRAPTVLVRKSSIASIRVSPGTRTAVPFGNRASTTVNTSLAAVLFGLVPERPRLLVGFEGRAEPIAGELRSAGRDVLTVRLEGDPPPNLYLPLAAVSDVSVLLSG